MSKTEHLLVSLCLWASDCLVEQEIMFCIISKIWLLVDNIEWYLFQLLFIFFIKLSEDCIIWNRLDLVLCSTYYKYTIIVKRNLWKVSFLVGFLKRNRREGLVIVIYHVNFLWIFFLGLNLMLLITWSGKLATIKDTGKINSYVK